MLDPDAGDINLILPQVCPLVRHNRIFLCLERIHGEDGPYNVCASQRLYQRLYPNDAVPSRMQFMRVRDNFQTYGLVEPPINERDRPVSNGPLREAVLNEYRQQEVQSARGVAIRLNANKETVRKIVRKERFPYKQRKVQRLRPTDIPLRLSFCTHLLRRIDEDGDFLRRILFTDESIFTQIGPNNNQNVRCWALKGQDPYFVRPIDFQNQWRIMVWAGIVGDRIIGPYFFENRLDGQEYLRFLRNILPGLLINNPIEIQHMWFQQDGAPAHNTHHVTDHLNEVFRHRWFGLRAGLRRRRWPARSPDLTPLDFYLWGKIKQMVYRVIPTTRDDMRQRITDAFGTITVRELQRVRRETVRRLQCCIQEGGDNFEHCM